LDDAAALDGVEEKEVSEGIGVVGCGGGVGEGGAEGGEDGNTCDGCVGILDVKNMVDETRVVVGDELLPAARNLRA
jgi:hypothetical protein